MCLTIKHHFIHGLYIHVNNATKHSMLQNIRFGFRIEYIIFISFVFAQCFQLTCIESSLAPFDTNPFHPSKCEHVHMHSSRSTKPALSKGKTALRKSQAPLSSPHRYQRWGQIVLLYDYMLIILPCAFCTTTLGAGFGCCEHHSGYAHSG